MSLNHPPRGGIHDLCFDIKLPGGAMHLWRRLEKNTPPDTNRHTSFAVSTTSMIDGLQYRRERKGESTWWGWPGGNPERKGVSKILSLPGFEQMHTLNVPPRRKGVCGGATKPRVIAIGTRDTCSLHLAAGGPEAVKGPDALNLPLVVVPAGEDFVLALSSDGPSNFLEEGFRVLYK